MQIYVARFDGGQWQCHAITDWEKPIEFSGRGAMPFIGIRIGSLQPLPGNLFAIKYRHRDYGSGRIVLDAQTLRPVDRQVAVPAAYPGELMRPAIDFEGIRVKLAADLGTAPDARVRYVLRWETLEPNHDRPRQGPLPPASVLKLVTLRRAK